MLQGKVVFYFDKAREMGKEEGRKEGRKEGNAEGQARALSILQTIISLKDESEADIVAALAEQYGLKENEAQKFIDVFNMIRACRNN